MIGVLWAILGVLILIAGILMVGLVILQDVVNRENQAQGDDLMLHLMGDWQAVDEDHDDRRH